MLLYIGRFVFFFRYFVFVNNYHDYYCIINSIVLIVRVRIVVAKQSWANAVTLVWDYAGWFLDIYGAAWVASWGSNTCCVTWVDA